MSQELDKLLSSSVLQDYILATQLRKEIDRTGFPLDLEVLIPSFSQCSYTHKNIPLEQFRDSISPHQIYSKAWIIKSILGILEHYDEKDNQYDAFYKLKLYSGGPYSYAYFGSWLGFGALMVAGISDFLDGQLERITLIDNDEAAMNFATDFVVYQGYNGRFIIQPMEDISAEDSVFRSDLIVNPVCEHLSKKVFDKWWSKIVESAIPNAGRMIVLQSTDMDAEDHVNKCYDADGLVQPEMTVLYKGQLKFEDCSRYMVIGTL